MLPYYLLIVPIAIMATLEPHRRNDLPFRWIAFLAIVVFVGLRHHVGMDWNNYLIMIQKANVGDLWRAFDTAEPGYALLLWIAGQNNWGVYGAYLIGTLIFTAGLFRYVYTTPRPWIALLVAIPFPVIVIAMAAARQTVAMGVLLWLVADWNRLSVWKRVALVLLAAAFHYSALVFLIFVFLGVRTHWSTKLVGAVVGGAVALFILQRTGQAEYYDSVYVTGQTAATQSSGAILHVLMNGGPALLAFMFGRRVRDVLIPDDLHRNMALLAIALIPTALVMSVAAGRMTLYLFPVSMWFFSALPSLIAVPDRAFTRGMTGVFFVGLIAFWLNYANSSVAYKHYQNALLLPEHELRLCCR